MAATDHATVELVPTSRREGATQPLALTSHSEDDEDGPARCRDDLPKLSPAQWAYIAACLALIVLMSYAKGIAVRFVEDSICFMLPAVMAACFPWQDEATAAVAMAVATPAVATEEQKVKKPRYHYLDNIKSLLTCVVTFYHVGDAFSGGSLWPQNPPVLVAIIFGDQDVWMTRALKAFTMVNQSYFMSLFFFISGYFTPRSHARKGTREFIKEKLIRYGIPFLVYFWLLNPLAWVWQFLMFPDLFPTWSYVPFYDMLGQIGSG